MDEDQLDQTSIGTHLNTKTLPQRIFCYPEVSSTMDSARQLLPSLSDADLPMLVQADLQTHGRGRRGRTWIAPSGSALLISLALRPTWLAPQRAFNLVWMAGVALCDAVHEATGLSASLKWPNDLLVPTATGEYAKAAGILLEASGDSQSLASVIIGIGVNVHAAPPAEATRYPATSLSAAAGQPIQRLALLRTLLRHLDHWHHHLLTNDETMLFAAWRARLHTLGRSVSIQLTQGTLNGYAEAVDHYGNLILRDASGGQHTITTGDVGMT